MLHAITRPSAHELKDSSQHLFSAAEVSIDVIVHLVQAESKVIGRLVKWNWLANSLYQIYEAIHLV